MKRGLVIFGTAEIAELAKYYFSHDSEYHVAAFTVDDAFVASDQFLGLPVVPYSELATKFRPDEFDMHVALSYGRLNQLRQDKYEQAKMSKYSLASYVCSKSVVWPDLSIGDNCFILENQTIQPTVRIGNNVTVWSGNHLGHASEIGDHTYIASHVVISGHCKIGQRCFLGVNATVRDFTVIGDDCFIAMAATVTGNVETGAVVVGASGETFTKDDRRAQALKKKYFKI